MKIVKKNQIIIYVIALMLVTAGYLNYTANNDLNTTIQTSSSEEELMGLASNTSNIGDAQLVSSVATEEIKQKEDEINIEKKENEFEEETLETNSNLNIEYYTASKLERDKMYSQIIETYTNILNSSNSSETQKQSATEEINKINNIKNSIMISENLLKTKGFENCLIFVNEESINVIVEISELTEEKIAQIQNIISREMKAAIENIHISNK